MADKQIKTIVDHIGRTVLGVLKEDTKDSVTLFNPVIIHVQPDQQTGQLQVQSFPYIFMEFLKDKEEYLPMLEESVNEWSRQNEPHIYIDGDVSSSGLSNNAIG